MEPRLTSLTIQRQMAAEPGRIWRAWTDPAEFAAWMWPPSFQTWCEADVSVGGRYRLASPVAEIAVAGAYEVVEQPHQLAFTWRWDGEDEQTLVTLTLSASGDGTELTIEHDRFSSDEARTDHIRGWEDCLDRLPGHLAGPG
jgi:uncharacterized protein YndB with AHSA1/START domain